MTLDPFSPQRQHSVYCDLAAIDPQLADDYMGGWDDPLKSPDPWPSDMPGQVLHEVCLVPIPPGLDQWHNWIAECACGWEERRTRLELARQVGEAHGVVRELGGAA